MECGCGGGCGRDIAAWALGHTSARSEHFVQPPLPLQGRLDLRLRAVLLSPVTLQALGVGDAVVMSVRDLGGRVLSRSIVELDVYASTGTDVTGPITGEIGAPGMNDTALTVAVVAAAQVASSVWIPRRVDMDLPLPPEDLEPRGPATGEARWGARVVLTTLANDTAILVSAVSTLWVGPGLCDR